jgi:hypothetical protein
LLLPHRRRCMSTRQPFAGVKNRQSGWLGCCRLCLCLARSDNVYHGSARTILFPTALLTTAAPPLPVNTSQLPGSHRPISYLVRPAAPPAAAPHPPDDGAALLPGSAEPLLGAAPGAPAVQLGSPSPAPPAGAGACWGGWGSHSQGNPGGMSSCRPCSIPTRNSRHATRRGPAAGAGRPEGALGCSSVTMAACMSPWVV